MYDAFLSRIAGYTPHRFHLLNEHLTRAIARSRVAPGDVVLDVGANNGFHTAVFALDVGADGMVHAFEPNPDLWIHHLGQANVRLWPVAVGDCISVERLIIPLEGSNETASLVDPRDFLGDVPVRFARVPQVPIDSLVELFDRRVSFIKIDVERRELEALKGMERLVRAYRPTIVFENESPEIRRFLGALGYQVSNILPPAAAYPIICNCVALHRDDGDIAALVSPAVEDLNTLADWIEANF